LIYYSYCVPEFLGILVSFSYSGGGGLGSLVPRLPPTPYQKLVLPSDQAAGNNSAVQPVLAGTSTGTSSTGTSTSAGTETTD
jgi:hypothetical protein